MDKEMENSVIPRLMERDGGPSALMILQQVHTFFKRGPHTWLQGNEGRGGLEPTARHSLYSAMMAARQPGEAWRIAMGAVQKATSSDLCAWNDRWYRKYSGVLKALERAMMKC